MRVRPRSIVVTTATIAIGLSLAGAASAQAATPPVIGSFPTFSMAPSATPGITFSGTANWSAAAAFPATTITTNAKTVSAPSGESAFLGASTGFGSHFGSSRSQPYLYLAPAVGGPSTTTITFAGPPPAGWGLAVGDIDADFVQVIPGDGTNPLPGSTLHAQDTGGTPLLNYCNNTPKPSTCTGPGPFTDHPNWYPNGTTIGGTSYTTPIVDGSGTDTSGAYDWFLPDSSIRTITLVYTAKLGFPTYQLWLVAPATAAQITGTIAPQGGAPVPPGVAIDLQKPDGTPVLDITDQPVSVPVPPSGAIDLATETGQYQLSFQVPAGFDPIPPVLVDATGTTNLGTLALAPAAPTAPPVESPPPAPELAPTGTDAGALAVFGGAMLVTGFVLRRPRRVRP
jgi:hypothetical protein